MRVRVESTTITLVTCLSRYHINRLIIAREFIILCRYRLGFWHYGRLGCRYSYWFRYNYRYWYRRNCWFGYNYLCRRNCWFRYRCRPTIRILWFDINY